MLATAMPLWDAISLKTMDLQLYGPMLCSSLKIPLCVGQQDGSEGMKMLAAKHQDPGSFPEPTSEEN